MSIVKILHSADWHFDCKFSGIYSSEIRKTRQFEQRETFKNIINIILKENIDFFLISGDLFEQNSFRIETINFIISTLAKLPCPVLITPGNHDPFIDQSPYKLFDWGSHVHIFTKNEFTFFKNEKATIYGIANTMYKDEKACLENFVFSDNTNPVKVVMLHGTYMDILPSTNNQDVCFPFTKKQLEKIDVGYVALGHFHNIRNIFLQNTKASYPGTPEGTSFLESGARYANLVEVTSNECKVEKIRVNKRDFIEYNFDVTGINNLDLLCENIIKKINELKYSENLLYVTLSGTADFTIKISEIESILKEKLFYITIKNQTISAFNLSELKKTNTLIGDFIREVESNINNSNDEEQKIILSKALNYGLCAFLNKEDIEI